MEFDISGALGVLYRAAAVIAFSAVLAVAAAYVSRQQPRRRRVALMNLVFAASVALGGLIFVMPGV